MNHSLLRSIFPVLLAACLVAGLTVPAQARTVEGFNLPETLRLGGQSLTLVGAGVRTKWFVNVYVMGVYQKTAKASAGHLINDCVKLAATQFNRLCRGQRDRMVTDAQALLIAGVEVAAATWKLACEKIRNWSDDTIDEYVPHQVSQANMDALNATLGLTPEKSYLTFPKLGNVGPAAVPISLAMADEAGRLKSGSHVAILGIGSGLNCSMVSLTW